MQYMDNKTNIDYVLMNFPLYKMLNVFHSTRRIRLIEHRPYSSNSRIDLICLSQQIFILKSKIIFFLPKHT
jgi:hypothetical protein